LSTPNKSSTHNTSTSLKEEWTQHDIKVLIDSVNEFTDEKGRTNWPEVNKNFPKRGIMAARSKYGKICRKQIVTSSALSSQPASKLMSISSSTDTADNSSIGKKYLPEANEVLVQIRSILNSQGLSNKQLLHLIQCEVYKSTYAGGKIKKYFKDHGDDIGEILGFDGSIYTVMYTDKQIETYSEAEIMKYVITK
jgi:hypothetical protein